MGTSDSKLIDSALRTLLDKIEATHEREVIAAMPYESDPDLSWAAPAGPVLPYAGDVPDDVMDLVRARRRRADR